MIIMQVIRFNGDDMEIFELIAPCHFGLEAVLKREIQDLGYEVSQWSLPLLTAEIKKQGIVDQISEKTVSRFLKMR